MKLTIITLLFTLFIGCDIANDQSIANGQPDINIDALKLYEDYLANMVNADNLYNNRNLVVSNCCVSRIVEDRGKIMIEFNGEDTWNEPIYCIFLERERDKIATLRYRKTVKVRGICFGKRFSLHADVPDNNDLRLGLEDCLLTE